MIAFDHSLAVVSCGFDFDRVACHFLLNHSRIGEMIRHRPNLVADLIAAAQESFHALCLA
jgi:hypothetical protein